MITVMFYLSNFFKKKKKSLEANYFHLLLLLLHYLAQWTNSLKNVISNLFKIFHLFEFLRD